MSIQAVGWVFEQDIPSRAKIVLLALANHADHVTGHCFYPANILLDCPAMLVETHSIGSLKMPANLFRPQMLNETMPDGRLA